jgi:hypothetical protein
MSCTPEVPKGCEEVAREPNICPDYSGTTIPPNIAPMNFRVLEPGRNYVVKVHAGRGQAFILATRTGDVRIPVRPWQDLLAVNKGGQVCFDVYVEAGQGGWKRFRQMAMTVVQEDIDGTLVYRRMNPVYTKWNNMGIYQRNLDGYDESLVLHGRSFGQGCLNCHSFAGHDPATLTIGLRSEVYGSSTLLVSKGAVQKIGAKWGYTAWHPSGRVAVYSINKVCQFFHAGGQETRDVADQDSALACYRVRNQDVVSPPELAEKDRLETYPAWSPDGKWLYYCSGPILWKDRSAVPPENYEGLRYDLRRISYDVDQDRWGQAQTVLSAEQTGLSILLPRISPNGKFLLFCMCQYGCFPVFQPSSDLYMMDLSTGQYNRLLINSDYSESWHSWSSNSHWIAFSSKRQGGLFTRIYLGYVDDDGKVSKPFVLPQQDPATYERQVETYHVPELVQGPVQIGQDLLARAARSEAAIKVNVAITGATPQVKKPDPATQERE